MSTDAKLLAQQWADLKVFRGCWTIDGTFSRGHRYHRVLGGRSMFGGLTLTVSPAPALSFAEDLDWPHPSIRDEVIQDIWIGVFEALATIRYEFIDGVCVTLTAVEWSEVDSCAAAFYHCARECVSTLFTDQKIPVRLKSSWGGPPRP